MYLPQAFSASTENVECSFFAFQTYDTPGVSIVIVKNGREGSKLFYKLSLVELTVFAQLNGGQSWKNVIDYAVDRFKKSPWVSILAADDSAKVYEDLLELL